MLESTPIPFNFSNEEELDEYFFSEFEYLQQDHQEEIISPDTNDENFDNDEVYSSLKRLDANTLTLSELLLELERRGIQAKGFFSDDAQVLQVEFEKELEQYKTNKRTEILEAKLIEAAQAKKHRRDKRKEEQLKEEKALILQDHRMAWLHSIRGTVLQPESSSKLLDIRIQVPNETAARLLAKTLWTTSCIGSLDLSRMGLSDIMGAYICRSLRFNKSVFKLELGENRLGEKTCLALEIAIRTNHVLKYISLESNPLMATSSTNVTCIQALASIIETTSSLTSLSLWKCSIGPLGGELIAQSILRNNTLTCIEMGYNNWNKEHVQVILSKLDKNKADQTMTREEIRQRVMEEQENSMQEEQAERVRLENVRVEEWLRQQEILRCQKRTADMDAAEAKAKEIASEEEERRRQIKLTSEALAVKFSKTKNTKIKNGAKEKKGATK